MKRVDLQVPFAQKDEAKKRGAQWDNNSKVWYVPEGVDPSLFKQWLPGPPQLNTRAERYFIAESLTACWKCGEATRVLGIVLPAGHETAEDDNEWTRNDDPAIVSYASFLLPDNATRIQALSRKYRVDFSKTTNSSYWMNHCDRCGMKQGDFELYCEPDGAFFPTSEQAASRITLHSNDEAFGGVAQTGYGDYIQLILRES